MTVLTITSFGAGVALEGSAESHRTDELQLADGYDIGPRGQLVATSDRTNAFQLATVGFVTNIYRFTTVHVSTGSFLVFVVNTAGTVRIVRISPSGGGQADTVLTGPPTEGHSVTFGELPFVGPDGKQKRVVLVSIAARPGQTSAFSKGLYVIVFDPAGSTYSVSAISSYDALGTGTLGEFSGGTSAVMLYPRGIIVYNNHVFLWGFDKHDTATGDAPNRLMFSNTGNPLKYGNDPDAAGILDGSITPSDRTFNDTDAFTIGGVGSDIRAGCVWAGKLWIATNDGLHYVEGFGRESFLANGALPVSESKNVIGPYALIEGPDRLLHGVSDQGHWIFNGSETASPGDKVRSFDEKSNGYWDLIWSDPSAGAAYPGKSNQDLVWMLSVPDKMQVWIGIPYCSIANGYGAGSDTVVIKYHCPTPGRAGGYTRQKFPGVIITAAEIYKRDQTAVAQMLMSIPGATTDVQRYGYQATKAASPAMPSGLPDVTMGEYSPHGPVGVGVSRRLYLTLSWQSASSLPLVFLVTPYVDQAAVGSAVRVTITAAGAPGTPSDGDLWVDTSGTDTNLGNGTAGAFIPANPNDYIMRRWVTTWAKWVYIASGGEQGLRATLPIAFTPARGTRVKHSVTCVSAAGRYQIEGLALEPATISETV